MNSTVTKSEADGQHPASNYLVATDAQSPSTWHLRVKDKSGKADPQLMGAAHAALTVGYRGNKYEGPDKAQALEKLKALYREEKMDWPGDTSATGGNSGSDAASSVPAHGELEATHGKMSGKPSISSLKHHVTKAIQEDPRFDTDSHGQPEGSPGDIEPECVDILVPDDDGKMSAVIRKDDGSLVKHGFRWDGSTTTMDDGDSEPTEATPVYSSAPRSPAGELSAAQTRKADGTFHGAAAASREAFAASATAKTSQEHKSASDLHKKARDLHRAEGNDAMAAMHDGKMTEHNDCANALTAAQANAPFHVMEADQLTEAPQTPTAWKGFMAMAGGVRTFTLGCRNSAGQKMPVTVTVDVNAAGAAALQAQLEAIRQNSRQKAFNCFDHGGSAGHTEASSWPVRFFWNADKKAIYEAADPSDTGAAAIAGKRYRGFSLTFFTNAEIKEDAQGRLSIEAGAPGSPENPAVIVCPADVAGNPEQYLNMGTLTNRPASVDNEPLFASQLPAPPAPARNSPPSRAAARNAGAPFSSTTKNKKMDPKQLDSAALQAEQSQLEQRIERLEASSDAAAKAQLEAAQAELREIKTKLELAAAQERINAFETAKQQQLEAAADAAVEDMINSQQIARFDKELQAQWRKDFIANPDLIKRVVKAPAGRVAGNAIGMEASRSLSASGAEFGFSVPVEMKQMLAIVNRNAAIRIRPGMSKSQIEAAYEEKGKFALQAGLLYKKALAPHYNEWKDIPSDELAKCVGLNPMEAMQQNPLNLRRALEAGDYADPNNQLGTLSGTLVLQRTLPLYALDYPEFNMMFTDFSDAPGLYKETEMTRVLSIPAVQIYNPALDANGRPIGFVVASAAQTVDASLELSVYIAVPIVFSQATLSATNRRPFDEQAQAGIKAIAGYFAGMIGALLTPANFNAYAAVTAADANGYVAVPTAYATYAKGIQDFGVSDLDKLDAIFTQNKVPGDSRGVLMNTDYFAKLRQDVRATLYFATRGEDPNLTEAGLPTRISGFAPFKCAWLPATNNLAFFPFQKAAITIKSRLPMDFTQAVSAMIPGSITTVTDPDTKFSLALVQRVDLVGNYAEWRPEVQLGANKGDGRGGLCGTTQ